MARRQRSEGSDTEAAASTTEEAAVTTATEAPPAPAEGESTSTTSTDTSTTSTKGKGVKAADVDLTAFNGAVETAVAQRDESTGDLAVAVIEPVVVEYRKLDGIAAKNKAKGSLAESMKSAMNDLDIALARSYMVLQDNLSAGTPSKAERQPADPTEAHVQRVVGLDLARALLVRPEGVSDEADERAEKLYAEVFPQAQAYLDWSSNEAEDKGDEPEAPTFVKNAVKLALGKAAKVGGSRAGGGGTGERHDIGEHIRQAFEPVPSGQFLTIAEIRNHKSTEYGDNPPSAGAISARLFPQSGKCTLEFVTPGQNEKGNRGATKV